MLELLNTWDQWFFSLINGQWHNDFLDWLMPYWRNKRTWIPMYLLILAIIARDRGLKTIWILLVMGATIAVADQVSSQWIKKFFERPRPCNTPELEGTRLLLENCGSGYSFTSSHATNHFAVAMQFFNLFRLTWKKQYFVLLFIWAGLIAYGQVYVGVHYPFDVFCGAILGCILATVVYAFFGWLGIIKRIWS